MIQCYRHLQLLETRLSELMFTRWILITIFTFVVIPQSVTGQSTALDTMAYQNLQSPTAASLGRFGETPVSHYTGIPDIKIPLTELNSGPLKLPVFLQYHGGGLKADDVASWVGLGWALNSGGVITRSVRGCADEKMGMYYSKGYQLYVEQIWANLADYHFFTDTSDIGFKNPCNSYEGNFEPDVYFFNFGNQSGKFVLPPQGVMDGPPRALTIPHSKLNIQPVFTGQYSETIGHWKITDTDGTIYIFAAKEINMQVVNMLSDSGSEVYDDNISWYLTEIKSSDEAHTITLNYSDLYDYYNFSRSAELDNDLALEINFRQFVVIHGQRKLKNIETTSHILEFTASDERWDAPTYKPGKDTLFQQGFKLTEVALYAKHTDSLQQVNKWDFEYGYFNDEIPDSLESHINKDNPQLDLFKRLRLDRLEVAGQVWKFDYHEPPFPFHRFNPSSKQFENTYVQLTLPPYLDMAKVIFIPQYESDPFNTPAYDHWGYFNGDFTNNMFNIPHLNYLESNYNFFVKFGGTSVNREPNEAAMRAGTLTRITYPTGGYTEYEFEANRYRWVRDFDMDADHIAGGLRIKKIATFDGLNSDPLVTLFEYSDSTGGSTGTLVSQPQYMGIDFFPSTGGSNCHTPSLLKFHDSSLTPLGTTMGGLVGYEKVTLKHGQIGELGREVYRFESARKKPDSLFLADISDHPGINTESIESSLAIKMQNYLNEFSGFDSNYDRFKWGFGYRTEMDHQRGRLLSRKLFDAQNNPVKKTFYSYTSHETPEEGLASVRGFSAKKNHCIVQVPDGNGGNVNVPKRLTPTFWIQYEHPIEWSYLDTTEVRIYDSNGIDFLTTIQVSEHSPDHLQRTRLEEINSDEQRRITEYRYAHEEYSDMAPLNMLSQLYSVTVQNEVGEDLQKQWQTWAHNIPGAQGHWKPLAQWQWNGSDSTAPAQPSASKAIQRMQVDSYHLGNVSQITNAAGLVTELFFGSNDTLFQNTGMGGVSGVYLTGIRTSGSGVATTEQSAKYDERGRLKQMTDANDKHHYYGYDDFNRLISIKGHASSAGSAPLLQEIDYETLYTGGTYGSPGNHNRIVTRQYAGSGGSNIRTFVEYFDGLGRPVQSQQDVGNNDAVITHTFYDAMGREEIVTKPITWSTDLDFLIRDELVGSNWTPGEALPASSALFTYHNTTLEFSSDDSGYAYSQTAYRADPLGRAERQASPGWLYRMGASPDRTLKMEYGLSSTQEEQVLGYSDGIMHRHAIIDENNKQSWSFTDGWGNTIAQVTDLNGDETVGYEDIITRFQYDLLGNLTNVHEPNGFERTYVYDKLGRLDREESPDMDAATLYAYDKSGNIRFIRNAEHKKSGNQSSNDFYLVHDGDSYSLSIPKNGILTFEVNVSGYDFELGLDLEIDDNPWRSIAYNYFDGWETTDTRTIGMTEGSYRFILSDHYSWGQWIMDVDYTYQPYQFKYIKYDQLGRIIEEGKYLGDSSAFDDPANAENPAFPTNNKQAFIHHYYDTPIGYSGAQNLKGRLARSRYLDQNTWLWGDTWYSYDEEGRVEWVRQKLPGLATKLIEYEYNRQGQPVKVSYQPSSSSDRLIAWYEYDSAGRLSRVYTNRTDNKSSAKLEAAFSYGADGQVIQKALGGDIGTGGAQMVDYDYNIRGWLRRINNPDNLASSPSGFPDNRFAMELNYEAQNTYSYSWVPQYNGNISQIRWKVAPELKSNDEPLYNFQYDAANRLTLADFYHNDYAEHMDNALDERNISYDKNGNILTLHRYGAGGGPVEDYDFYDYRYYPGTNRLKNVAGSPTAEHYRYDGLGNMIYNQNRQITSAGYDGRNLVYRLIQRQNANNAFLHHYGYDAGGLRVSRRFFQSGMTPAFIHRYVRGADGQIIAVYNGTSLMYWNIPGGLGHIVK